MTMSGSWRGSNAFEPTKTCAQSVSAYNAGVKILRISILFSRLLTASLVLTACKPEPLGVLESPESEFSPVRYKDRDLLSLNTRCPVTDDPLSTVIEPVYANGRPIGFC